MLVEDLGQSTMQNISISFILCLWTSLTLDYRLLWPLENTTSALISMFISYVLVHYTAE